MKTIGFFGAILIAGLLSLFCADASFCVVSTGGYVESSAPSSSAGASTSVSRMTAVVKSLDGILLHTNMGTFNLGGVKVNDFTTGRKLPSNRNKIAELTFINNILTEVTIRQ